MTLQQGIRTAMGMLFSICLLWGLLPLTASRIHTGCVAMIAVGSVGMAVCVAWPQTAALCNRLFAQTAGKIVFLSLAVLASALVLLFVGVSAAMIAAACRPAPENATVIVLGAGLRGENPSRTLRERLDAAYTYLIAHPDAPCIVTGGQGDDEVTAEAAVMKAYLLERGIDEHRLYVEDKSTSTAENFEFSRQLAETNGLPLTAAVVTQEFHQCRAQLLAKQYGFTTTGAVTAHTKWDLLPSYWIRDFAGLCRLYLLGE